MHDVALVRLGESPILSLTSSGGYPRFAMTFPAGVPAVEPFARTVATPGDLATRHTLVRPGSARGDGETGKGSWVSLVALIGAAVTVGFVAWRSQRVRTPPPPAFAMPIASIAEELIVTEVAPSASVAPVVSSRPVRLPRSAVSHAPRGTTTIKPPLSLAFRDPIGC